MLDWPWLLVALAIFVVAPFLILAFHVWVIAPIRVHRNMTVRCRPDLVPGGPERLTPEMRQTFQVLVPQFEAEGFEVAAYLYSPDAVPRVRAAQALLVNRTTGDVANLIAVVRPGGRSLAMDVERRFSDGTMLTVDYKRTPTTLPRNPASDSVTFPRLRDPHALCEIHRRRLKRVGKEDVPGVVPEPGAELDWLTRDWDRSMRHAVACGYRYVVPAGDVQRYTWKGAFLATWKLASPLKGRLLKRLDRRARRLWRELGMDDWKSPAALTPLPAAPADEPLSADNSELRYETRLAVDEIREEPAAVGTYTVRIGRPTVSRYLAGQWPALAWLVILSAVLAAWAASIYRTYLRIGPAIFDIPKKWLVLPLLSLIPIVSDVVRLLLGVLSLHGTTVLAASEDGLAYRNIHALRGSGQIPRSDLRGLRVVKLSRPFRKPRHALVALLENGRRQTLVTHPDAPRLATIRAALAQALGIESPEDEARRATAATAAS
jgi:hypothetical protein